MFDSLTSTIKSALTVPILGSRRGPNWRLSTWWPSDSVESMQRSLLRLLSLSHAERLDLEPLITNLANEHRGGYRRRLRRLARRLGDGTTLVDALEQTPDVLRDEHVLAIRFASQTGTLDQTYGQLIASDMSTANRISANLRQTILYAIATLCFMGLVLSFLIVFLVPPMEYMYRETNGLMQFPWAFSTLIAVSHHLSRYWILWALGMVAVGWLIWSSSSRRLFRRTVATRWLRGAAQTRSAEFLRSLSLAVEAGRPLPAALSTLARYHFDTNFRHRLMVARIESEHRDDLWNVLSEAHLLSPQESAALATASCNETRVWMMRRIADLKEDKVFRKREMLASLVRPLVVMALALGVLLIASAWVNNLSQMVQTLALPS